MEVLRLNKYCVIAVYFGKFPQYINLWMKSCSLNPTVDFLIITDQVIDNPYDNIKVIPMTLEIMKKRVQEKINISNVSLDFPYKCCDFRPAFGVIFDDYIEKYEYWGHCDFDMIFGNLDKFFNEKHIEQYDKFLTQGHLSMYRNTREINERYRGSGGKRNYITAFTTSKSCIFDESCGIVGIYLENKFPMYKEKVFADITPIHHRFTLSESSSVGATCKNYYNQIFSWQNGSVYREYYDDGKILRDEFIYIHFRSRPDFDDSSVINNDSFYITPNGFEVKNEPTNLEIINRLNGYSRCRELIENISNKLKINELKYHLRKII